MPEKREKQGKRGRPKSVRPCKECGVMVQFKTIKLANGNTRRVCIDSMAIPVWNRQNNGAWFMQFSYPEHRCQKRDQVQTELQLDEKGNPINDNR